MLDEKVEYLLIQATKFGLNYAGDEIEKMLSEANIDRVKNLNTTIAIFGALASFLSW